MSRLREAAFSVLIGFMVVTAMFAPFLGGVGIAAAAGTMLDDFEDNDLSEWSSTNGWQVSTDRPFEGSYSAKLPAGSTGTGMSITSSNIEGAESVSAWVYKDGSGQFGLQYADGQSGIETTFRIESDDTVSYYNSAGMQSTSQTVPSGEWLLLKVHGIDRSANTLDFSINDTDGNTLFHKEDVSLSSSSDPTELRIYGPYDHGSASYVDNVGIDGANIITYAVSGTVSHSGGGALENAAVEAIDSNGNVVSTTTTDSAGAYSFDLQSGDYTINVTKSGYISGSQSVSVTSDTSGVDFTLSPEDSTIVGHVEDQDGQPQGFATVKATNEDTGNLAGTTKTDGSGNFSFAFGSGNYSITVEKGHYAGASKSSVYTDGTTPATDAGTFVISRLGQYEDGLYKDMRPNLEGNLSTDLDPHCSTDRSDILHIQFGQMLFGQNQTCEADMTGTTQIDMVESGVAMNQTEQEMLVVMSNRLEDVRGLAYTRGKIAAAEALNNGKNQSQAREAARDEIERTYAVLWENTLSRWSTSSTQADYIHGTMIDSDEGDWIYVEESAGTETGFGNKVGMTVTLPNDETISVKSYTKQDGTVVTPLPNVSSSSAGTVQKGGTVKVYGPDKNASTTFASSERYAGLFESMRTQEDQVKGNVGQLVSSLYDNYDQDEINTSDLLSPVELGTEAATSYNSTGYYSYAAAEMSALGYGGDTQHAQEITLSTAEGDVNKTGSIFYTGDDKDQISTGETIDPTNYNGSFMLATNDGIQEVNDPFTVDEQTDVTSGETVSSTSMEDTVSDYGTADSSNFSDTVDDLKNVRDSYQQLENSNLGGGGGGGIGLGSLDVVGALAGALGVSREVAMIAGGVGALAVVYGVISN